MNEKINSKQKIIILIIILVLLIIGVNILKNLTDMDDKWNYSEITSANDVISKGSAIYDRKVYYELEDIIVRFLLANDGMAENNLETENVGYEASYKDYYSILTDEYKKHLSRNEFNEKANTFLNKFIKILVDMDEYKSVNTKDIITGIYEFGNNQYLCKLQNDSNTAYMGIQLNPHDNNYNIFYIE